MPDSTVSSAWVMVFFQARLQLSSGCKGSSHCRTIRRFWRASKAISMGGAVQICWKVSDVQIFRMAGRSKLLARAVVRATCHKLTRGFQIAQASWGRSVKQLKSKKTGVACKFHKMKFWTVLGKMNLRKPLETAVATFQAKAHRQS